MFKNPKIDVFMLGIKKILLLVFLMPNRIYIPQSHRITAVALHLGVFHGIIKLLGEALWIKSIKEANDKLYQRYQPTNLVGVS
jgi:hypothetical protein